MIIYSPEISGSVTISGSLTIQGAATLTASLATSASYALTASYALNGGGTTVNTGSFVTTSSFNAFTSSINTATSSFVTNSQTSSFLRNSQTSSFLTTGSSGLTQTISGSLIINQNLTVLGSSSILYVTSSQLNIGTNIITVNANVPEVRYGGLAVIDSGSSPQRSGSILFDSTNNQWIFVHQNTGGAITSSVFIQGPQTFNNVGNETTLTANRITKATGGDLGEHIGNSNITDTGTLIQLNSATQVTGSLNVSAGITGSLFGTSSWANNTLTASFVNTLIQNVNITGNVSASGDIIAQNNLISANSIGSEGGEILLYKSATNNTLTGSGVTIDSYQNRIRIFEQAGNNRGGYFDIASLSAGVATNLQKSNIWFYDAYLVNTQTTAAGVDTTINNISLSTQANEAWSFEFYGVGQVSGAGGARFTIAYSAAAVSSSVIYQLNSTALTNWVTNITSGSTPAQQSQTLWGVATTDLHVRIAGSFVNGANANTVTVKVQPFNAGQTVTIRPMAYFTARRII